VKDIALTWGAVLIAATILCLCGYGYIFYWDTTVLEYRDTMQFKAVSLPSPQPTVRISGLSGHSALAVKKITTEKEGSSIIVLVHLFLAKEKRSGSFEYDVPVPDSVNEIRFGKGKVLIWKRESRS
jgi:hypothetical protein